MAALSLKPFRRTFGHLARHRAGLALGLICIAGSSVLALLFTDLAGSTLDLVRGLAESSAENLGENSGEDARGLLLRACMMLLAVLLGGIACRLFAGRTVQSISRRVEASVKSELVAHVNRLPAAWFDGVRTGDLISRLTQDVQLLRRLAGPVLLQLTTALVLLPGGMFLVVRMSPNLFFAMILAYAVVLGSVSRLMPRLKRQTRVVQESIAKVSQRSSEDFSGIRLLTSFGRARRHSELMHGLCDDYLDHSIRLTRTRARLRLILQSSRHLTVLGVLVVGGYEAVGGRVSLGDMFQLLLLAGVMVQPLMTISATLATLYSAAAAAERVEQLFDSEPESNQGLVRALRGRIRVENLSFSFAGQAQPALQGVSFELEAGQKLGLVGPAGSGKSTLLALLTRLYEPPPGTVFVDGIDVLDLRPQSLRAAFAVAAQDAFLFSDTLAGNIAFGADGDSGRIGEAVHMSAVDQDIESYPEGLDTAVGERGLTLSGGQRQRVSLARALASERNILVLDDALSGVDYQTEAVIRERLDRGRSDRTVLVASHRISGVSSADLILVLQDGRVTERGTHDELIKVGGYYAQAHALQRQRGALEGREGS